MGIQDRRLVLVAGPGRSGTSLISGMLRQVGWHVPQPEFPSSIANPKGYSESQWVYKFHELLLRYARVRYITITDPVEFERCTTVSLAPKVTKELRCWLHQTFQESNNNAVLIKDPRTACFIPMWLGVADSMDIEVSVVSVIRDPLEVIGSQNHYYRPADHNDRRLRAWTLTAQYCEYTSRAKPRSLLLFKDLIADPARTFTSLKAIVPTEHEHGLTRALEFVDPALYRIRANSCDSTTRTTDPLLKDEAYSTLAALTDLSQSRGSRSNQAELTLDRLRHLAGFHPNP